MSLFIRLDVNIFAALILVILLLNNKGASKAGIKTNQIFSRLTGMVLLLTLTEIVSFAVEQQPGAMMPSLNYISNVLLYLIAPFAISLWAEYVEH